MALHAWGMYIYCIDFVFIWLPSDNPISQPVDQLNIFRIIEWAFLGVFGAQTWLMWEAGDAWLFGLYAGELIGDAIYLLYTTS